MGRLTKTSNEDVDVSNGPIRITSFAVPEPPPKRDRSQPATVRTALLMFLRGIGVFGLARVLTAGKLRIIGYHGLCKADEFLVCPWLFMGAETFERRMKWLADHDFTCLTISSAVRQLESGTLPKRPVAITFDDGWQSVYSVGLPILQATNFTATVYVSTFYVKHQEMVFSAALNYAKAKRGDVKFRADRRWRFMHGLHKKRSRLDYSGPISPDQNGKNYQAESQNRVLRTAFTKSDLSFDAIEGSRMFHYMNAEELNALVKAGVEVQLHTHSHRMTDIGDIIRLEIETNQREIREAIGSTADHFAYPCGYVTPQRAEHLKTLGIKSAVTCESGLNDARTDLLYLKRFVDCDTMPQIVFEAEMSGVLPLLRTLSMFPRKLIAGLRELF